MTDFQTFAVNLAIAVLKIQAGQRYGDEHDLLNLITSLRESPSASSSSQRRPVTRDQQTQTDAATSSLGRHITIRPRASSKNRVSVSTSTSRRMSIDISADESSQDAQDYDHDNNNDDDDDEPLVRRRRRVASPAPEPQPTPPLLEYNHEFSPQFPNGDVTYSHNHMPGQTPLDTRSVGWAFFVYKTETYKNHKTFRKSCLGIYMCPECKTTERPRIPHTGQHYKHKPPFPPKTICCGRAPIHIPCMCLLRIDDDGTKCTFQHTGYHNHPKPQTIRPSRAGKRRFAEIIETAPEVGPAVLVSGSTDLPPLAEIDPFYADSEHVAYHRRRLMRAAERASVASSSEANEGSSAAANGETPTTMEAITTTAADSSSIKLPSLVANVYAEGATGTGTGGGRGGREGATVELPGEGSVSLSGVSSSNASIAQAVTAFMHAYAPPPMPSAVTAHSGSSSAIPGESSSSSGAFSASTLFSAPSTSSAIPTSTSSTIPTTASSESPSSTTTSVMARTSTLRADSTEVAIDKVSIRGIRPVCLSCGQKIDRGLQRLVFTGPDANKRYKKNESCHVQGACVDALSPEMKALVHAFWQKMRSQ